jgi:hypothetical protein
MTYCITLRSRIDTKIITGLNAGGDCRWSTDHKRPQLFDDKHAARVVCDELRSLCPRNGRFHSGAGLFVRAGVNRGSAICRDRRLLVSGSGG